MNNVTHTAESRKPAGFWKTSTHVALCWLLLWSQLSQAALTDLSSVPLASSTSAQVKPNIMYLMDTSGSMAWSHMPDDEETNIAKVGYKNNLCNTMYYNPNSNYTLPKKADGTNYPTPSFTGAYYDGYVNTATTVNLSTSFRAYDSTTLSGSSNDTAQAAYYYKYTGGQKLVWHGTPCTQTIGTSPFAASGQSAPASATDTLAPPAPTFTLTNVGASAGSLYTAGLAGNYKYQITAFNNIGESAPSALSSAVAIAAGQGVQIVITDNGGSVPATGYRIYRTAAGGSTTTSIYSVERAFVNSVPQATTTMVDLNDPGTWTKVLVNSTSGIAGGDERQNFANWYSYYRTRIMMMKSAATRAFIQLTDSYRVGFITISPGSPVSSSKYLKISDFDSAQKTSWFSTLTSQGVANSTPNREALARVGRYFAGKTDGINNGITDDPMQYSCQQNFVILTTDGYWNGNGGVDLTGTAIGNTDGSYSTTPPPAWDGTSDGTSVVTSKSNVYNPNVTCTPRQQRTQQVQKRTIQNTTSTAQIRQSTAQTLDTRTQTMQARVQTMQTNTQTMQTNTQTMDTRTQTLKTATQTQKTATQTVQTKTQTMKTASQTLKAATQTMKTATQTMKTATQTMKTATQTMKTATQTLMGSTATTNGTATMVFTSISSGAVLTAITINGVNQLNASITSTPTGGSAASATARKLNMKNALVAAGLKNGYTIVDSGTCTGAGAPSPYTSCASNTDTYLKIMAPLGSGTTISTLSFSTTVAAITVPATFNNGGVVAGTTTVTPAPADPATCVAGTVISGNTRTVTTCTAGPNTFATAAVQPGTCVAQTAAAGNSWTDITCAAGPNTFATAAVAAGTCLAQTAAAGNSWTGITCTPGPNTLATAAAQPGTCSAQVGAAGNAFTDITCTPGPNTFAIAAVAPGTCLAQTAALGNSWTAITCTPGPNTFASAAVAAGTCAAQTAAAGNSFTDITCTPGPNTLATAAAQPGTCSAQLGAAGNSFTDITCTPGPNTFATAAVAPGTCLAQTAALANSWTNITCTAGPNTFASAAVQSTTCAAQTAAVGNGWTTITCTPGPNTFATAAVAPGTCAAQTELAGNQWTAITCTPGPNTQAATPILASSCAATTAVVGNGWTTTTCTPGPNTFATTAVQPGTCSAQTAGSANAFTDITCTPGPNTFATAAVQAGTCSAQTAAVGNAWTDIVCTPGPNTQAATAVQTCGTQTGAAGNQWTSITCTPGPNTLATTAVQTCAPQTAAAGNAWTTIACTPGPNTLATTAVQTCGAQTAAAGNAWTTIACTPGPNTQASTAVSSCSAVAAAAGNSWTATTCTPGPNTQAATGVSSCSPQTAAAGNNWTTITCTANNTTNVPVASCSPITAAAGNAWTTTTCNTVATGPTNIGTCAPIAAAAGNSFTATTCAVASDTDWVNVTTCAASNPGSGPTVTCQTADTGFVEVDTCTASSGSGRTVTCQNGTANAGRKIQYTSTTTVATTLLSGGAPVGSPITTTTVGTPVDMTGFCYQTRSIPAPPAAGVPGPSTPPFPPSGCSAWPCTVVTNAPSGGSSGSLADVAAYYYNTDLRPTMTNNVPTSGTGNEADTANWQHMTTFTMGLGLSGTLTYRSDYKTANVGDFEDVREVSKLWPVPVHDDPTALDDLWHAAVNGRGQFFSAADPDSVVSGLLNALAGISARVASAAAAATSNLEPVAGDNFAYTAKYVTTKWTGELEAHEIDLTTGEVKTAIVWSAQSKLDAQTRNYCDNRTIYLFRSGATDNLTNFTWNTQACDTSGNPTGAAATGLNATEQAYFNSSKVALFSQFGTMTDGTGSPATADQRTLAAGANMVNYVRGQRGYEGFVANDQSKLYRTRDNVLGDIVNAQPVYVKAPFASYLDADYAAYKTAKSTRTPMVFVAANDGMLHAFYAGTSTSDTIGGEEAWTFIPSMVLPNLYKLADTNYSNNHQYSVDGTPSVGDIYDSTAGEWKTLLVAGLNGGGKGYYALDVTTPTAPKAMWEFKWSDTCYDNSNPASRAATNGADCHIGYTFSNPILTKARVKDTNSDGVIDALDTAQWVVLVTSGYNNVNSPAKAGDGGGYLYVLDAATGKIYYKIATNVGTAATPSGLNHINNWVENTLSDNFTVRVYGGDLLGNVWRFDINDTLAPSGREATKVAELCRGTCNGLNYQPITTRPELAESGGSPMVFVATGSMLGSTDLSINTAQSIYGIVDPISTTPYVDLRASLKPLTMAQVGSGSTATRTISCTGTSAQCNSNAGWYVDLPLTGERVNVDMKLQLGTLVVASNIPANDACSIGGTSWLNYFNYSTGEHVANSAGGKVAQFLSNSLAVGLNIVRLPSGKTVVITTTSDAKQTTVGAPFDIPPPSGKRISWREITQ